MKRVSAQPKRRARPETLYLHPGQVFASATPTRVTTILGSCVAVTLWEPRRQIGGINHFLVPYRMTGRQATPRAANVAIEMLLEKMTALGAERRHLEAGVYGGACVLDAFRHRANHLGKQNVRVALVILEFQKIAVLHQDWGGRRGRKLVFDTGDGTTIVRPVGSKVHGV